MPAWAYVSHGSGVSVNVGNTAIIDEQAAFLAGFSRHGLSDAMAHLNTREKRQQSKLLQWLGLSDDEISALDSVQRIGHQEHWSTQRVHEIVFFNDGLYESSSLRDSATWPTNPNPNPNPNLNPSPSPITLTLVSQSRSPRRGSRRSPSCAAATRSSSAAPPTRSRSRS